MGRADGDLGEHVASADQAPGRAGIDIAVLDDDFGAEMFKPVDEQVDRPRADGAAAGQRHLGLAHARKQRADDPEAGAHLRDKLVGRGGVDNGAGGEMHGAGVRSVLALAPALDGNVRAMIAQNPLQLLDIGQMRQVFQRQGAVGEQRGNHQRQRGVFSRLKSV